MIHAKNISYCYKSQQLDGRVQNDNSTDLATMHFADVQLAQGSTLVLRGASGSGKSTWLALLAGLLTLQTGELVVAGQKLNGLSNAQRDAWRAKYLGFMPQRLHMSEALTVAGNLQLAYFAAGINEDATSKAHVLKTLQKLGIENLAQRKPSALSVGQVQRVALARAVLLQPKIILADEPTASLDDATAQAALTLLLHSAQDCQASLVIATHDARVLQHLQQQPGVFCLDLDKTNNEIGPNSAYLLPSLLSND